jgi:signal transduction histidine kinase
MTLRWPLLRTWVWSGAALLFGALMFFCDDIFDDDNAKGLSKTIFVVSEFIVMIPAMATLAFFISEHLRARDELHRLSIERERQKRFQFLGRIAASMAHEVRNPLHNLILLNNELSNHVPSPYRDLSDRIGRNIERLEQATHIIYELAQPQRRMDGMPMAVLDLAPLIRQISDEQQASAAQPAKLTLHDHLPVMSAGICREAARIILQNLVRNAIEASAGDEVRILAREIPEGVRVEIRNRGAIDAAVLDANEDVISGKSGGLGVGLAISRHLAAVHGGKVELSRDDGWVVAVLDLPGRN